MIGMCTSVTAYARTAFVLEAAPKACTIRAAIETMKKGMPSGISGRRPNMMLPIPSTTDPKIIVFRSPSLGITKPDDRAKTTFANGRTPNTNPYSLGVMPFASACYLFDFVVLCLFMIEKSFHSSTDLPLSGKKALAGHKTIH